MVVAVKLSCPDTEAARLKDRRVKALGGARAAIAALAERGVTAKLIGSLADGRFDRVSDVDLLVTTCPRSLKYAIESVVEDCLPGFTFDVIYLDELPPARALGHLEATHAFQLGP